MAVVDLHLHTTASDGRLAPAELVRLVVQRGLRVVAITDHDSTEGLAEALETARSYPQLTVIPGIELSVDVPGNEIHLLGYFIDSRDQSFQEQLARFRASREERARAMVQRLAELGLPVEWERVKELAGDGAIGRPHIALAMVERSYISSPQEAFAEYIGRNGPAYVERHKLVPTQAVELLLSVGGFPVLAHPAEVQDLARVLDELQEAGLVGMEVFYASYPPERTRELLALATQRALLPCGGSDYHAMSTPGEPLPGEVGPPIEVAYQLLTRAKARERAVDTA
ncbi:MAG: PHP domain-containing protein [Dehalococcoidia bacterium]